MKCIINISFILVLASCVREKSNNQISTYDANQDLSQIEKTCRSCDSMISALPNISDTSMLIAAIRMKYNLEVDDTHGIEESITECNFITIGTGNHKLVLLEYDYKDGCMAAYPWKYQVFLNEGCTTPLHIGSYDAIQPIELNNEKYILTTSSTGKGNGIHKLLTYSNDSIINVLDLDYNDVPTVDSHGDDGYYVNPLITSVKDYNLDGYDDLIFSGRRKMLMARTKSGDHYNLEESEYFIKPVAFVFLFDSTKNKYSAQEDYWKKYVDLFL